MGQVVGEAAEQRPLDQAAVGGGHHDVDPGLRGPLGRRARGVALEQRTNARARKDYAAADAIRDQLTDAGVIVEDTPNGPRWTVKHGG